MPDSRLVGTPTPGRRRIQPSKEGRKAEKQKTRSRLSLFAIITRPPTCFNQPIVAAMIKSCMLQLITSPCYDAEMMVACLSANSVRRSSRSKKLHTFLGLSDNNADGGLNVVAYLKVSTQ